MPHAMQGVLAFKSLSVKPFLHENKEHGPTEPKGSQVPAEQEMHEVAGLKSASVVPSTHETHGPVLPAASKVPLGHWKQDVAGLLSTSDVPAGQIKLIQGPDEPRASYVPTPHPTHGVEALKSSSELPGTH